MQVPLSLNRDARTRVAKSVKAAERPFFFLEAFIFVAVATRISAGRRERDRVSSVHG